MPPGVGVFCVGVYVDLVGVSVDLAGVFEVVIAPVIL